MIISRHVLPHALLAANLTAAALASAAEIAVASAGDIENAMSGAQPGDTLVLANGSYSDLDLVFSGDGAPGQPITLRAQTPGEVVLAGDSTLSMSGSHLVAEGLRFQNGALEGGHVVRFRTASDEPCHHCVLRDTAIIS